MCWSSWKTAKVLVLTTMEALQMAEGQSSTSTCWSSTLQPWLRMHTLSNEFVRTPIRLFLLAVEPKISSHAKGLFHS
jgi:hypothetical protein